MSKKNRGKIFSNKCNVKSSLRAMKTHFFFFPHPLCGDQALHFKSGRSLMAGVENEVHRLTQNPSPPARRLTSHAPEMFHVSFIGGHTKEQDFTVQYTA